MPPGYVNHEVLVDGPVVHHFDQPGWRGWRPGAYNLKVNPLDIAKSMGPADTCYLETKGGGAAGTPGYCALTVSGADEFYNESAPTWWIPGRYYDLRDTWCVQYLKEIEPVTVDPGFEIHVFIAAYMPKGLPRPNHRLGCWYLKETLTAGKGEWAYNETFLANDPSKWVNYHNVWRPEDTLDEVLAHCGFIGWMYSNDAKTEFSFRGVNGSGTIGWDEFAYNLTDRDLEDLRAGRPLTNALVL